MFVEKISLDIVYRNENRKSRVKSLSVNPSETIKEVNDKCLRIFKNEIEDENKENLRLHHESSCLVLDYKISEIKFDSSDIFEFKKAENVVENFGGEGGGGFVPNPVSFFKNPEKPIFYHEYIRDETKIPDFREFKPGLNIELKCKTPECKLHNEGQIRNLGFGRFEPVQFHMKDCVECDIQAKDCSRVGVRRCIYRIEYTKDSKMVPTEWIDVEDKRLWFDGEIENGYTKVVFIVKRKDDD